MASVSFVFKTLTASILLFSLFTKDVQAQFYMGDPDQENQVYCFQCNSQLDSDCSSILPNQTDSYHYKPCLDTDKYNGTIPFCRKIIQRIFPRDNLEVVIRKCGWVKHERLECYNLRNEDHIETICQCFENGCNGSLSIHKHSSLLLIFIICLAKLY